MKSFAPILLFLFVSVSMAMGQKAKLVTTGLFTKKEVKFPDRRDPMPSYLVYDSIEYAQVFPFNFYKKRKGFKSYPFTLVGWFLKSGNISSLFPFQNFVQGVIIDKLEGTKANYPFVSQGNGVNGLNEVLYIGRIHMDLNPKGGHDFIHYIGYLKNGIPDFYGSFEHLTLNGDALMFEEGLYKGDLVMAKRNGEGCYSNGRPEVDRGSLENQRSALSGGMANDNIKYGIPIVSICGTYQMDTLVFARYVYEDGSYFVGKMNMPFAFPAPYLHYGKFFELKGNGKFTKSDGTALTGEFNYPYIYVNGVKNLVANPANIKRDMYVSPSYRLCQACGGGGMLSKSVTTRGGAVVLEKTDVGNGYVQYNTTRNAPTTFHSLKDCSACTNGRVKTTEPYIMKVSIAK